MHWQVQCNSLTSSVSCKEIAASHLSFALLMRKVRQKKIINVTACLPVSFHPSVLVGRLAGQMMILSICADERHAKPSIGLSRVAMCLPIQNISARFEITLWHLQLGCPPKNTFIVHASMSLTSSCDVTDFRNVQISGLLLPALSSDQ